jgi:uncharacterized protein (TIGR02266 family)
MPDEPSRKLTGAVPITGTPPARTGGGPGGGGGSGGHTPRDPRLAVVVPVRYRYESIIDFIETQSMNISRSGMFMVSSQALPVGTVLDFEFSLADGYPLLRGKGEVVRASQRPAGVGVRFQQLDEPSRKLIDRVVEINLQEGRRPTVSLDFAEPEKVEQLKNLKGASAVSAGVEFNARDLRIEVNPGTAAYFTNNPLLNIRLGGFVVPSSEDVPLGTMFTVTIHVSGNPLFSGKGKVVAKHEMRLGIRLTDVPKETLARLQAEITRAAPSKG